MDNRVEREIKLLKSICVKLILSDIDLLKVNEDGLDVQTIKTLLLSFKSTLREKIFVSDDENIIRRVIKYQDPKLVIKAAINLFDRSLTMEHINNLVYTQKPTNLAEALLLSFQKIINKVVDLALVRQIVDEIEDYILVHEKEYILQDLQSSTLSPLRPFDPLTPI